MDLQRIVSGFPQIMTDILSELNFEDLLEMKLVSTGLYQFLMEDKQVWIGIFTKIYTNLLENNEDWRFPLKLSPSFETKEEMRRAMKQQWMDIFDKITKIASIPSLIKMCQLFSRAPKNFGKILSEINNLLSEGGYPEIPDGHDDPTSFMRAYFWCTWAALTWN